MSSRAVRRYQSSAICSSLDGSHSRALTRIAALASHRTAPNPPGASTCAPSHPCGVSCVADTCVLAHDIDRMDVSTKQGGRSALHALFRITPFVAQSLTARHTPKIGGIQVKLRKLG